MFAEGAGEIRGPASDSMLVEQMARAWRFKKIDKVGRKGEDIARRAEHRVETVRVGMLKSGIQRAERAQTRPRQVGQMQQGRFLSAAHRYFVNLRSQRVDCMVDEAAPTENVAALVASEPDRPTSREDRPEDTH
jgi:hypothetical protein